MFIFNYLRSSLYTRNCDYLRNIIVNILPLVSYSEVLPNVHCMGTYHSDYINIVFFSWPEFIFVPIIFSKWCCNLRKVMAWHYLFGRKYFPKFFSYLCEVNLLQTPIAMVLWFKISGTRNSFYYENVPNILCGWKTSIYFFTHLCIPAIWLRSCWSTIFRQIIVDKTYSL